MRLRAEDIQGLEREYRKMLINSISGWKPANLIGTRSQDGIDNLAIFSSVVHLGSDPPLLGMFTRPVHVSRHTYTNILASGFFTINQVSAQMAAQAHQTSARYDGGVSEFEAAGLRPLLIEDFPAAFVAESRLRIGCKLVSDLPIEANGTRLLIGEVILLEVEDEALMPDGFINLAALNAVAVSGLDSYNQVSAGDRYAYAKPDQEPRKLPK